MARVTYGPYITELAGSVGGFTFLRNASGPIVKLRSNPTVNPSPDQIPYQTSLAKVVAYWPTLSQANKEDWDTFAAAHDHTTQWGETKILSGYQWFISINLYRLLFSLAILPSPPAWYSYPPPDSFTLVTTDSYLRCEWDDPFTPVTTLLIYLTLPLRQSSLKLRRSLYYVGVISTGFPLSNYDLTSKFESLANVTWADFYASANCSIICRLKDGARSRGYFSPFTSAIVKIG